MSPIRRLYIASALIFGALCLSSGVQAQAPPPREDHQFWNEGQLVKPITPRQDLVVIGVLRIGRGWKRPVEERIGAGWALKPNKYVTVMPTYLHVEYQPFPGRIIHEERLVMNITGKITAGQWSFTDRNLFERRVRPGSPDFNVYRNRLQIDHPARIGRFKFKPYVADEFWYSTQRDAIGRLGWFRNRISVGIIRQLNERLTGEIFLLYQHDGRSRPGNIPAVGTLFRYTL